MKEQASKVFALSARIINFNPNHKYRFLVWAPPTQHWLANLAFARNDDSIYISPQLQRSYTISGHRGHDEGHNVVVEPDQDIHLSFHHSGVVNLTIAGERIELRRERPERLYGRILTIGVRDPSGLKPASNQEVNALPKRYSVIPVIGFLQFKPIYLTIFRVPLSDPWEMPQASDTFQIHFECLVKGKNVKYEFVIWQNSRVPLPPTEVAISD